MNSLPILSLPYVARIEVYQYMGFIDLLDLSICSKRTRRILKCDFRHKEVSIEMHLDHNTTFYIGDHETIDMPTITKWGLEEEDAPNHSTEVQTAFKELSEVFRIKVMCLTIDMRQYDTYFKEVVAWINTISHFIKLIVFEGDTFTFTDYKWILENVTSPGRVCISMKPMKYEEVDVLNVNMQCLSIEYASWIELKHILEFDFKTFSLEHLYLTGEEMNQYLKLISAGNYPKLETANFMIYLDPDMDEILDGLNVIKNDGKRVEFLSEDGNMYRLVVWTCNKFVTIDIEILNRSL